MSNAELFGAGQVNFIDHAFFSTQKFELPFEKQAQIRVEEEEGDNNVILYGNRFRDDTCM